jgi:arylsulfatase A-like enzyme
MKPRIQLVVLLLTSTLLGSSCSKSSAPVSSDSGGQAAAPGHHPVVVMVMDGVRVDALGSYGAESGSTPSLDAFASRAVRFDWAFAQAPDPVSSMASMLTGLYPTTHGLVVEGDRLVEEATTVAEALSGAGMTTAAFLTNGELFEGLGLEQGFEVFATGPQALDEAAAWIAQNQGADFFLLVEIGSVAGEGVDSENPAGSYAARLATLDSAAGGVLDALDGAGLRDRATVAVLSLTGFDLGEHGEAGEGSIYATETRVPMMLAGPGVPENRSIDKIVEVIDLGPTLVELAGEEPWPEAQGRSLLSLIGGEGTPPYVAFGETPDRGGETYAALGGYRLIRHGAEGSSELFELYGDPTELADLAEVEANRVAVLEDHLAAWQKLVSAASLDPDRRTEELDDEALEQLKSLGYIQ